MAEADLPTGRPPEEQLEPLIEKPRTVSSKDLLGAPDIKTATTLYLEALKNSLNDRSGLQETMARKLLELGETDQALRFAALSQETRNADQMRSTGEALTESLDRSSAGLRNFEEASDTLNRGLRLTGDRMEDSAARFASSSQSFETSAKQLDETGSKIARGSEELNDASRRIENAVHGISEAVSRMRR